MTHVRYIDKTRDYYLKEGYDKPYAWAHHDKAPLTRLSKPLSDCRVALLTTSEMAIRYDEATEENPIQEEGFRSVYAIPSDTPSDKLYCRTHSYDRYATHMNDVNSYFPIERLREARDDGRIGDIPDDHIGCYNNYSQRKVLEEEAPKVLAMCKQQQIDAVLLVPV